MSVFWKVGAQIVELLQGMHNYIVHLIYPNWQQQKYDGDLEIEQVCIHHYHCNMIIGYYNAIQEYKSSPHVQKPMAVKAT